MDTYSQATSEHFLARVARLIDWARLTDQVGAMTDKVGKDVPMASVKMLLLARWYGLDETALREACQDRISFRRFLGLPLTDTRDDARLADAYRRNVRHAPVESQNLVHAVEAQVLEGGFSIRPGVSAEAAAMPVAPVSTDSGAGRVGIAEDAVRNAEIFDVSNAAAEPDPPHESVHGVDPDQLRETLLFQPGELADLLREGESALVRGGARAASSPYAPRAEELTPPPVREAAPLRISVEWPWGDTLELTDRLRIGRDHRFCLFANELQPYLHVSRQHAELTPCPEGVWVRDLKSRNGTFVNDDELPKGQATLVDEDAQVRFGPHCTLKVRVQRP